MDELFGRDEECGRLRELLDRARRGLSGVLVLHGEPGVGKTALLDHVQRAADGFDLVRVDAVENEAQLGYAALHRLLRPGRGDLDQLPAPRREALETVFGLRERGGPPDRLLVGLASLELLTARAAGQPLLLLVDDAHCLDQESAEVLAFICRRLHADSIAVLLAVREPSPRAEWLTGLPELAVSGLAEAAAHQLLAAAADSPLDPAVRGRIVAQAGGNPLALIEAAAQLTPAQLAGQAPLPEPIPPGRRLARLYLRETLALPRDTRLLLLAAAAGSSGDPGLLWRAGTALGFGPAAATAAEQSELLTIRETVQFRSPLIRSAVYYGAPLAERQRVHAGLADAAGAFGELDRRAWHLASAITALDAEVAAELEAAAERERARGGWADCCTLLARAAALSEDPADRARRVLAAAESACVAGTPARAQALLDEAAAHATDPHGKGLVQRVQGRIHRLLRNPAAASASLLSAATALGPADRRLARDILLEAVVQAQITDRFAAKGATRVDVARVARALPLPAGARRTTGDALLDADAALQLDGLRAAAGLLRAGVDAVRGEPSGSAELFQWLAAACAHATVLADDVALHELAWRLESEARIGGAVIPRALALSHTGLSELLAGMLRESERCFNQRSALVEEARGFEQTRGFEQNLGALLLDCWRGREESARGLIDAVAREAAGSGQGYQMVFADYGRCVLELGLGRYREAFTVLADGINDSSQLKFALADLVEAAERCGEHGAAKDLLGRLAELAAACPVPRTLGYLARARALMLGDEPEAEPLYLEAIEHHENTRGPAHRARSRLVYGEWLRRARRSKQAREQLRAAHALFDAMGAAAFAARAAQELSAAGETPPARRAERQPGDLTSQEARVARLAAAGATNAEIAARLYLSVFTVDHHLRKAFRKLEVHSRRELAAALGDVAP